MDTTDLCFTPATELARAIQRKDLSPVEITQAILERIQTLNPEINAYLAVDTAGALKAAQTAEDALTRGEALGPLGGLPVSIKDLEPTAGLPYTAGCKLYVDRVAEQDGIISERVRAAGGVILGKTNTPHVGHRDMCDNLLGPHCRNPWKADRTPGGSSGGAAAAVAAGMGPLAHGSDGAGSIRIPAALCGVFGFKPSFGRVPYWPNADIWAARSHNGPLTRTVADAALFMKAVAGPDPRDPTTINAPPDDYLAALPQAVDAIKGLRVAWSVDFGYAAVDPAVRSLTTRAAERFSGLGCTVEAVDPDWDDPREPAAIAWYVSMAARLGELYDQHPDAFEPSLAEMIEAGRSISGERHGRASVERTTFYQQVHHFFTDYDLLLTPQMPVAAWPVEQGPTEIDNIPTPSIFDRLSFTFPFNMTGQPAATLPCGFTEEGLPVALQVVGPWHADTLVLQASAAFEQVMPWAQHRPAL